MDQGVLENIKCRYKRDLLRKILLESEVSFVNFAKTLTIKDAVYASSKCWKEVHVTSLSRACNKLGLGPGSSSALPEEEVPEMSEECTQLGIDQLVGDAWLEEDSSETGTVEMTDEEIVDIVQEDGGSENEESFTLKPRWHFPLAELG